MSVPHLTTGKIVTDERGSVSFVNDFEFKHKGIQRFYVVRNHQQGFIRAWHGHRYEGKFITVVSGAAMIAAVQIDNWDSPRKDAPIVRYILTGSLPQVLYIPAGFANGIKTLTSDAIVLVFSTATVEESQADDIRFPAHMWDPWRVEER